MTTNEELAATMIPLNSHHVCPCRECRWWDVYTRILPVLFEKAIDPQVQTPMPQIVCDSMRMADIAIDEWEVRHSIVKDTTTATNAIVDPTFDHTSHPDGTAF